jgi:hypothetical protein
MVFAGVRIGSMMVDTIGDFSRFPNLRTIAFLDRIEDHGPKPTYNQVPGLNPAHCPDPTRANSKPISPSDFTYVRSIQIFDRALGGRALCPSAPRPASQIDPTEGRSNLPRPPFCYRSGTLVPSRLESHWELKCFGGLKCHRRGGSARRVPPVRCCRLLHSRRSFDAPLGDAQTRS